ncbi:hypothetical protein CSUB01_07700 [Colletotrichum sublineola]|uniref:Uncharacterized protein n=1 Tax=Colletotrichum sublineola TaxID=1173701 RepID=A0A066X575_COLSU|nr:hypothetical protein CSUB01_07700 [Colletotrichum sublineola]
MIPTVLGNPTEGFPGEDAAEERTEESRFEVDADAGRETNAFLISNTWKLWRRRTTSNLEPTTCLEPQLASATR